VNAANPLPAFEFASAHRIIFGAGKFADAPGLALSFGKHVLLVTSGKSVDRFAEQLTEDLVVKGALVTRFKVNAEPDVMLINSGIAQAKEHQCDVVIGLGGGSAMDTAKCLSALLSNEGDLFDYLEVVGKGSAIRNPAVPCICIPTTAGTGSEVTKNAVISAPEQRVKASIRSPLMLARIALVDPELTYQLPPAVTAYTGLDALTQNIEPFISRRSNPITDAIALAGLGYAAALPAAYRAAQNPPIDAAGKQARESMALASLYGGLALANSGLGAVHGFAAVIGARYPVPHGAVCGILLPHVVEANRAATRDIASYETRWRLIEEKLQAVLEPGESLVSGLKRLNETLAMPGLGHYGVTEADIPELVTLAQMASSMKANPVELPADTLAAVLRAAL
jgi:alcohol dehydrogenase class IV